MGHWLTAVVADTSNRSRAAKVVTNKPADVVDACWTTAGVKIVEPQVLFGTGQCNVLFPRGVPPEYVAGAPIELDAIKCQLKRDRHVGLQGVVHLAAARRLSQIFPKGVCDWSKRGVQQVKVVPFASFGPSPENLLFDITDRRRHDDDDDDDDD